VPDRSGFHIIPPFVAINTGRMREQRGGSCCIRAVALVVGKALGVIVKGFAFGAESR